jgi:PEP-CTERM motif
MRRLALALTVASILLVTQASGATITVDEFGNGAVLLTVPVPLPFRFGNDPGPGGLNNVLIYMLPFAGVQGDVLLNDPGIGVLDVIRFNGDGTLIFYSDNIDGFDAPADTPSPPLSFYTNTVTLTEVGPEGNNGATYAPTPNQPGFGVFAGQATTYVFVSDSVPEPGTMCLMGAGLAILIGSRFLRS